MDTFYAHTATFVEVPLDALLLPGDYTIGLTLTDGDQGARAAGSAIALTVTAPAEGTPGGAGTNGLTQVLQAIGDGRMSILLGGVVLVSLVLGLVIIVLGAVRMRRRANRAGPRP